jgi:hypothetical protein
MAKSRPTKKKRKLTDAQIKRKGRQGQKENSDPVLPFKELVLRLRTLINAAKLAGDSQVRISAARLNEFIPSREAFGKLRAALASNTPGRAKEEGYYDPGDNDIANDSDSDDEADNHDGQTEDVDDDRL